MVAGEAPPHQKAAAAAAAAATAFLETSLGTRLAVSFPIRTTVADLKRKVSIEHAASFPHIGEITVKSIKVRRRGSLYHLIDSMVVKSAFHGIKGSWFLQVDAVSLHSVGHKDAKCGTDMEMHNALGSKKDARYLIGDCRQKMSPLVKNVPSAGDSLAVHDPPSQLKNNVQECVVHDPGKCEQIGMKASTYSHFVPSVVGTDLSKHTIVGVETQNSQCREDNAMSGEKPTLDVATMKDADPVGDQKVDTIKAPGTDMIIDEGNKYFREEGDNHENINAEYDNGLTALINMEQNDLKRRKHLHQLEHNSKSTKICKKEDGHSNEMGVDIIARTDVATCSSDKEISKVQAALEDTQNRDDERITLKKKEEGKSTKCTDKVLLLVASDNHEGNSLTNKIELNAETSTLGCLVYKNNLTAAVEKHADEECLQEKLIEEQEHLYNESQKESIHVNADRTSSGKAVNAGIQHKSSSGIPTDAQSEVLSGSFGIKCCKKSKGVLLAGQYNDYNPVCSEVGGTNYNIKKASGENHKDSIEESNGLTTEQAGNAAVIADSASPSTRNVKRSKKKRKRTEQSDQYSNPSPHDSADHAHSREENSSHGRKESSGADVHNDESSKYEAHCSEKEAMQKNCKEELIDDSADPAHCEEQKSSPGRKRSSRNDMHLAESSKKEANSLEKEVTASNPEEKLKSKTTCSHKNGTHSIEKVVLEENRKEGLNDKIKCLDNIKLAESSVEGAPGLHAKEDSADLSCSNGKISQHPKRKFGDAQRNLEKVCKGPDKNADDKSEIRRTTEPLYDQSKEQSTSLQGISFDIPDTPITPNSNDHYVSKRKQKVATSTDSTEQETWGQRRRHRVGVRKIPFSRLKKRSN